jgi:hypothetical protein
MKQPGAGGNQQEPGNGGGGVHSYQQNQHTYWQIQREYWFRFY